jgi:hypothetical protein
MGDRTSRRDQLLAIGLAVPHKNTERRVLPDRRSGLDRRKAQVPVQLNRRSGAERRHVVRRTIDRDEGPTLLQKARSRLAGRRLQQPGSKDHPDNGLR